MPASALLAFIEHRPTPFLIQFSENFGIRYYGLAYLLGFVGAGWLFRRYYRAGRTPLDPDASMDLMVALVIYLGYRFVQGVQWVMTHHH